MSEEKFICKIGNEDKTILVKHPSPRVEAEANMHSSRVFAKLSKEKDSAGSSLLLRAQLDQFLKDAQIYSEQDAKDILEVTTKIDELEKVLHKGGIKKSEGRKLAIELRKARYGLLLALVKRNEYDKNTIEYHAENARMNYLISKCLCFDDGSLIFKSVEDYEYDDTGLTDSLTEPIRRLASICSVYDPNFEANLPENKFLSKYKFCNDKLELVDENNNRVNEKGERIDDEGNLLDEAGNKIVEENTTEIGEFLED